MNQNNNSKSFIDKPREFINLLSRVEQIIGTINILITIGLFISMMCIKVNGKPGYQMWQTYMVLFSNIANTISVLLALHKRYTTYIWGMIACVFLGAIAYSNALFGTMITYWVLCIISQTFLLFKWRKVANGKAAITPKEMNWNHFIWYLFIFFALGLSFSFIESIPAFANWWSRTKPEDIHQGIILFDSLGLFFLLATIYLLWNCYTQVWYCYFFADIAWLVMWSFNIYYHHADIVSLISSISTMLALITMVSLNICGMKNWKAENNKVELL